MIKRGTIVAFFDSINGELEIGLKTFLTNIFGKIGRTERFLKNLFLRVFIVRIDINDSLSTSFDGHIGKL